MSYSRHPVALGLFAFYGRKSPAGSALVDAAVACLFAGRNGGGVPEADLARLGEVWRDEAVAPLYFDSETGRVSASLPGSEDAFADLRFLVLDEPTQRLALFGSAVSTIISR